MSDEYKSNGDAQVDQLDAVAVTMLAVLQDLSFGMVEYIANGIED